MNTRSRTFLLSAGVAMSAATLVFFITSGSDARAGAKSVAPDEPTHRGATADDSFAAFRGELLDRAFKAASALPVVPHIKNRSRAQEAVVVACLELDQPERALAYIEKIDNWRRGACYADLAFYLAQHGDTQDVERYLDLARKVADTAEDETIQDSSTQEWRKDRIRVKIAQTHALLGQDEVASRLEADVAESESGKLTAVRAMRMDAGAFAEELAALDALVATGSFDPMLDALNAYSELFDRFYDDVDRRAAVEAKIEACVSKMPVNVHIELLQKLARVALDRKDRQKALTLVNEAQHAMARATWLPEHRIRLAAQLAELRHRAGDTERARKDTDAALAMFDAEREAIVNIYRAGALREVAEAYQAIGDTSAASAVYKRAIEAGVENPNSRPRAEDLSATCCSMAKAGFEPDESLRARIAEVEAALGDPW